jgi:hypothetical protein
MVVGPGATRGHTVDTDNLNRKLLLSVADGHGVEMGAE